MSIREAEEFRSTRETEISIHLNLDGSGKSSCMTGVGFLDHMLELFARHSLIDLTVKASGDLQVDQHHTVEDIGLTLGSAIKKALGEKSSIVRYGHAVIPMDETRVEASLDLSGRAYLAYNLAFSCEKTGEFDTGLTRDFFQAFVNASAMNLHLVHHRGDSPHHIIEATFKAVARAFRAAIQIDQRETDVPSTKGSLV